ncbi:RNA polymerase-binding protein DksA [Buchnera aphidicola]|uniref:RNA polymerase-binding protein DksA n=1 Tax=Buchnera aphidicola TaxID=9 RepID=UPI0034642280
MNIKKYKIPLSILKIAGVNPYEKKKNEKYMNKEQTNHFKKILQAWKEQLNKKNDQITLYQKTESINFPDPIDRAVQEEEFNLILKNQDRQNKIIENIERTLKKIQNETFGYCELCEIEIGIKRLEARPTANLCIDCKTLSEIRAKQNIRRST